VQVAFVSSIRLHDICRHQGLAQQVKGPQHLVQVCVANPRPIAVLKMQVPMSRTCIACLANQVQPQHQMRLEHLPFPLWAAMSLAVAAPAQAPPAPEVAASLVPPASSQ
jgi:hypothetical protein